MLFSVDGPRRAPTARQAVPHRLRRPTAGGRLAASHLPESIAGLLLVDQSQVGPQAVRGRLQGRIAQLMMMARYRHRREALQHAERLLAQMLTGGGGEAVRPLVRYLLATQARNTARSPRILARLLGDQLLTDEADRLHPATRASTYRQKAQRSFAAEFLSPFNEIEHALGGDLSDEAQQEIAEHFQVSPLVVRTLLVNHGRLDREELDEDQASEWNIRPGEVLRGHR